MPVMMVRSCISKYLAKKNIFYLNSLSTLSETDRQYSRSMEFDFDICPFGDFSEAISFSCGKKSGKKVLYYEHGDLHGATMSGLNVHGWDQLGRS